MEMMSSTDEVIRVRHQPAALSTEGLWSSAPASTVTLAVGALKRSHENDVIHARRNDHRCVGDHA